MAKQAVSRLSVGRYFLGYDLGTSGVKTALIDTDGQLIQSAVSSYATRSPKPGWHEQDPEDWWRAIATTTREVIKKSKIHPQAVSAISFGVQAFGLIPVANNGIPLRPCMTWLDSRSITQAERIGRKLGVRISSKDFPAKAYWLKEMEPRVFAKANKLLDCCGYLITKFTGRFACPLETAYVCGYDFRAKSWKYEEFGASAAKMPEPVDVTEIVGETTTKAAKATGLRVGIPVVAGGTDFMTAVVGSGAIKPGRAHIYLGSSSWIAVSSEKPVPIANSVEDPVIFEWNILRRWIIGGESESACACLDWFKNELARDIATPAGRVKRRISEYVTIDRMAEKVTPGTTKLLFVPWMKGEKAPIMDDYARGAFIGLALNHRREHLVRALMEGVAFNMRWILQQMESHLHTRRLLRAVGGGFKSKPWTQIFADITGRTIEAVKAPQYAGAVGAGLVSAVGIGVYDCFDDLDGLLPVSMRAEPRSEYREVYEHMFANYQKTYPKEIREIYRDMGTI